MEKKSWAQYLGIAEDEMGVITGILIVLVSILVFSAIVGAGCNYRRHLMETHTRKMAEMGYIERHRADKGWVAEWVQESQVVEELEKEDN